MEILPREKQEVKESYECELQYYAVLIQLYQKILSSILTIFACCQNCIKYIIWSRLDKLEKLGLSINIRFSSLCLMFEYRGQIKVKLASS